MSTVTVTPAPTTQQIFDAAYLASLPPAYQAAMSLSNPAARLNALLPLLPIYNVPIDDETMVNGWDPYEVMTIRVGIGLKWVPSFGQPNIANTPGGTPGEGLAAYNPNAPWPGSVTKISTSPSDFPPYEPVTPPMPPSGGLPAGAIMQNRYVVNVGSQKIGNFYNVGAGDNTPTGDTVTWTDGHKYQKYIGGPSNMFEWYTKFD